MSCTGCSFIGEHITHPDCARCTRRDGVRTDRFDAGEASAVKPKPDPYHPTVNAYQLSTNATDETTGWIELNFGAQRFRFTVTADQVIPFARDGRMSAGEAIDYLAVNPEAVVVSNLGVKWTLFKGSKGNHLGFLKEGRWWREGVERMIFATSHFKKDTMKNAFPIDRASTAVVPEAPEPVFVVEAYELTSGFGETSGWFDARHVASGELKRYKVTSAAKPPKAEEPVVEWMEPKEAFKWMKDSRGTSNVSRTLETEEGFMCRLEWPGEVLRVKHQVTAPWLVLSFARFLESKFRDPEPNLPKLPAGAFWEGKRGVCSAGNLYPVVRSGEFTYRGCRDETEYHIHLAIAEEWKTRGHS